MNRKICNLIVDNEKKIVPFLFTDKQVDIIKKYLCAKQLSNTEKTYLYSSIKKKIDALSLINEEVYCYGLGMIPERVKAAKAILREFGKDAFISGSFLFSKMYNDIDIYIISNRRKQYHKGKKHFIFISLEDLKKPIFISALKYCVSNFFIEEKKAIIKRPSFNDLIMAYEIAINEILNNTDQKTVRDIIFEYYQQVNGVVLDSFSLYKKTNQIIKLKKEEKIEIVNNFIKELLLGSYSNKYVYNELVPFVKRIKNSISEFAANDNLIIYADLLGEVKDECRRAKT